MAGLRNLIVNADDLGLCEGVNAGVLAAHERGMVTSASLMVHRPAAAAAARLARECPRLSVGLHVDLAEWEYRDGEWVAAYSRCDAERPDAVRAECRAQIDAFRSLLGRDPTHLDSHQHVHRQEPVASAMAELAQEIGVPLRGVSIRYEGGFYGQAGRGEPYPQGIAADHLLAMIEALPPGWTEIGCHPGVGLTDESSYAREREVEVAALCDPRLADALAAHAVTLRSFGDYDAGSG